MTSRKSDKEMYLKHIERQKKVHKKAKPKKRQAKNTYRERDRKRYINILARKHRDCMKYKYTKKEKKVFT